MSQIKVRQVRSAIGAKPKHKGTLRALGLGRIGKTRELPDSPEIHGMIRSVQHLIAVEEVAKKAAPKKAAPAKPKVQESKVQESKVQKPEEK